MSALPKLPELAWLPVSTIKTCHELMTTYGELCRKQALEESKLTVMAWLKPDCEDTRNIDDILESLK